MERGGFTRQLRNTLFHGLTGRPGDVSGQPTADVRAMLLAIGGPANTRSGIDLTAVARAVGVSRRTAERWVTGADERIQLRGRSLTRVTQLSRQAATTQAGRRRAMTATRQSSLTRYGAKLSLTGQQGPLRSGHKYRRHRKIELVLSPQDVDDMITAYEQGGDRAYMAWVESYASENYLDDWGFDSVSNIDLTDPRESRL